MPISAVADSATLVELLQQVQAGSQEALTRFYDLTARRVYAVAARITGDVADAEEIAGDVYLQLWLNPERYDPARGNPMQWLMIIARTRALDRRRQRARQRLFEQHTDAIALQVADINPGIEELLHRYELYGSVCRALVQLSEVQARLIGLAFTDGLTHEDIAACTRLPLGTVKSHLRRALALLRRATSAEPCELAAPGMQAALGNPSAPGIQAAPLS